MFRFRFTSPVYHYAGLFVLLSVFLFCSFPGNRSENDDGYFYAYAIRTYDYAQLYFPRYLVFLPFFKFLLSIIHWVLPQADAYMLMCTTSAMATSVAVLIFFRILKQHFQLSDTVAGCSSAALLMSYGYWRYAVEAEVYAIALLLCLLTLKAAFSLVEKQTSWLLIIMIAALAALTALWYKPAATVVCIVVPLYLLINRVSLLKMIAWASITVSIVMAAYLLAFQATEHPFGYWNFINSGIERAIGHPLNAAPVIASNVVSLNFIYAFPSVVQFIEQWFPGKQLVEEIFAAKSQSQLAIIAITTFMMLLVLVVILVWKIRRYFQLTGFWKNPFMLWLMIYSFALLIVDPGSPEPWLMIQPALFAVIGIYIFPLIVQYVNKQSLFALLFLLFLHNFVGGYLFIRSPKKDYTRYQAAWLIEHASEKDMVISLGSASAVRYILYYGKGKVFSGEQQFAQAMLEAKQVHQHGGKIYLTDDCVHPSATVQRRNPAAYSLVQSMLQQQQANIYLLHPQNDNAAAVYEWLPK